MKTITKKEKKVLDQIRKFDEDYDGDIPQEVLQSELQIHEYQLYEILNSLKRKGIIEYDDNRVKLLDITEKINTVDSKQDVIDAEIDQIEEKSIELIKSIVHDGVVPKYVLEGNLLYGPLKLSDFRMYHVVISLTNKGIIKPVLRYGEQYYRLMLTEED
ncbi:MAG: hypothetical protein ACOX01_06135 [Methanobrevibacter boviskoreani]|jgi:hypothetical protein|uniref:hypothetical protein n=1 Tax=Methanobrevibacter boviskoreani TaxID=1348249 RepID=UPI000593063D|nr:hypothetical protein [Methanobrevibacter boviskoreani]MCI6774677.1 hypothetical protein [Methanobrevibacter boviskoreani]MDD6256142.1 hypothetical protein [Methanobrevibacter boviskoreani]MDY5613826.1 hypothetical protein [Methanobrevibacter boviskoreani]